MDAPAAFAQIRVALRTTAVEVIHDGYPAERLQRTPGVTLRGFACESLQSTTSARADLMLRPGTVERGEICAPGLGRSRAPVGGYRTPGPREANLDGATGTLTNYASVPLAEAPVRLLEDPESRVPPAVAATERAEAFASKAVANRWLAVAEPNDPSESLVGLHPMSSDSRVS